MKALKTVAIQIAALLVVQVLWLDASHAQAPAGSRFREEVSKQEDIYKSTGNDKPSGYTVDRGLDDYASVLPAEFDRELADLGPADRWLDIGAGEGQAILDYYAPKYEATHQEGRARRGKKARAVAMSIEDRRTPVWRQKAATLEADQIQYVYNRSLREYSREELGRFKVITDVIGGFSYTTNLSLFMEKVLGFLEVNGSFYSVLQDVNSEAGKNRPFYTGSPYLTEIRESDGSELKICSWLKSISCVQVTCELKTGWKPPIEAFHVRKVCDNTTVPGLAPVHYEAGTPPERGFQLRD
jgi:hypothetical protein